MYNKVSDLIMYTEPNVCLTNMSANKGIKNTRNAGNPISPKGIHAI